MKPQPQPQYSSDTRARILELADQAIAASAANSTLHTATEVLDPEPEEPDFYALRRDRIREERLQERRRQFSEKRQAESVAWRTTRDRDLDHLEARPELRLIEGASATEELEEHLSPAEEERFRRLVRFPARKKCAPCHWGLLVCSLLLTVFSIPLVYSASTAIALDQHGGDPNFFLKRQFAYALIGMLIMVTSSRLSTEKLRTLSWCLFAVTLLGLAATKFTPLGYTMGNVERWVKLGPLTFQFSELAKMALIGVMADFWSRAARSSQKSMWPWLATAGLSLPIIGLVFIQPHLSAALVLFLLPVTVAFYAGAPRWHFGAIFGPLLVLALLTVGLCKTHKMPFLAPYQQDRIAAHFGSSDGGDDARTSDYQALQGQRAIVRGGFAGVGVGASLYKQGHLPAAHTDFIYPVIAEEWGMIGALGLLFLYAALVFFCFQIGHNSKDSFSSLICAGVGTLLGVQALGNVAVVTGAIPVTGMPLPILTFGGSGLWCALLGIGLVLAVSRAQSEEEEEA